MGLRTCHCLSLITLFQCQVGPSLVKQLIAYISIKFSERQGKLQKGKEALVWRLKSKRISESFKTMSLFVK